MKRFLRYLLLVVCLLLMSRSLLHAQLLTEEEVRATRLHLVREAFAAEIPLYDLLKNGSQYLHFYPSVEGDQYYGDRPLYYGSLVYENIAYDSINLGYDIYNDLIFAAVYHNLQQELLILHTADVRHFELGADRFLYLPEDRDPSLSAGIYQDAYTLGDTRLLVHRVKKKEKYSMRFNGQKMHIFKEAHEYFLIQGDQVSPIFHKKSLLRALKDDGTLRTYMRKNLLYLKRDHPDFAERVIRVLKVHANL